MGMFDWVFDGSTELELPCPLCEKGTIRGIQSKDGPRLLGEVQWRDCADLIGECSGGTCSRPTFISMKVIRDSESLRIVRFDRGEKEVLHSEPLSPEHGIRIKRRCARCGEVKLEVRKVLYELDLTVDRVCTDCIAEGNE